MHEVRGGGGLRLNVREWGNRDDPSLLFIHGWSQSQLCWARQTSGPLAQRFHLVTFDNRGHGMSEKPLDVGGYVDAQLWADDVAAVIEHTALERPVLVASSYGGFIVCDYLRAYGAQTVAGINLAGAAVMMTPRFDHIGPGFLDNAPEACVPDLRRTSPPSNDSCGPARQSRSASPSGARRCAGTWSFPRRYVER